MAWARTTDSCGRYIAHALLSVLEEENPWKSCLFASKQQEKTNNENRFTGKFFFWMLSPQKSLSYFLYYTAPYMVKAGQILKTFYCNLICPVCVTA